MFKALFATALLTVIAACTGAEDTATSLPQRGLDLPAEFLVVGDFGDGSQDEYIVASTMQDISSSETIDALVTTGDNFYTDDVNAVFNVPYGWVARAEIPVFASWGNHDIETPGRERLVQTALDPPGYWYSVELGDGKLIVLDSNLVLDPTQTTWLEQQLVETEGPTIVVFHHPAYSCGFHGNTPSVVTAWVPLLEKYHVDLVLNGHDHDYQRFQSSETTYVVTGGGGRTLRPIEECAPGTPEPIISDSTTNHFLRVGVTASTILVEVIGVDHVMIDVFRLD